MERLVIVPDEKLEPLVLSLKARLSMIVDDVRAENIVDLIGQQRRLLPTIAHVGAEQELLLWARSAGAFLAAWTSRPVEEDVAASAIADLDEGLIGRVFMSGNSTIQTGTELQAGRWTNLEETRGLAIDSVAACPVFIFGKSVAVLTLAAYRPKEGAAVLERENLARVADAALLLGQLLEDRLIRASLGLELS